MQAQSVDAPTTASRPRTERAAVRLEGVRKVFGDVEAVAGIDLEIGEGEFFSMLGPSGSGKTTTLRMIAGFELPTAGRILLDGEDVSQRPPFERDVNTVFQDYALFPHMDVADNVAYGLMVRKVPREARALRVEQALRMVRLEGLDRRKIVGAGLADNGGSGGFRLGLGRGHRAPRVLGSIRTMRSMKRASLSASAGRPGPRATVRSSM